MIRYSQFLKKDHRQPGLTLIAALSAATPKDELFPEALKMVRSPFLFFFRA
jgi:hypothetical protein